MKSNKILSMNKLAIAVTLTTNCLYIPHILAAEEIEEVQVTGSRIRMTDGMTTATPVTAVTPQELASFEPGATVAEQLDALPQFFATQTAQRGGLALSGTGGGSYLNMRNLGANRTLVLLDGSRLAPADKTGSVNVDTLPNALIRTVDVVTGGASAAYGADALGGVTNFILNREFKGVKVELGTGESEFGDGFRRSGSIAGGFQVGEKLNIIASYDDKYLEQIDRDPEDLDSSWFRRWGHVTNPAWSQGAPAGTPQRLTLPWIAPTNQHVYGMISGTRTSLDNMVFNREGTAVRPFVNGNVTANAASSTQTTSGGPEAELANKAYPGPIDGAEAISRTLFAAAKYDFTDSFSAYVQMLKGTSESNNKPRRADTMGINLTSIWAPRIAVDNAYLPANVRNIMTAANVSEFILNRSGGFLDEADMGIDQRDRTIFRSENYTVGFNYDILDTSWNLSGSYNTGETEKVSSSENMMRIDRLFLAMDAVRDPNTGNIVCRVQLFNPTVAQLNAVGLASGLKDSNTAASDNPLPLASPIGLDNTVQDCVPFNVMGFGNISKEAIEYVGTDKYALSVVKQDFAEIVTSGDLLDGWGYGAVSAALGLTWRESSFADEAFPTDIDALGPPLNAPQLGIRGIPPGYTGGSPNLHQFSTVPKIGGEYDVWEWFTEVQAPFWESASGEQGLSGTAGFRSSDYNLSGRSDSWKIGLDARVMPGLRLRATKSHDVREATFSERFDAQGGGANIRDTFNNGANAAITVVASGNPNLKPEVANTVVAGVVFEPMWEWAQGFSVSSDWYKIEIEDAIQQIAAQDVVDRCFAGDQTQCDNIDRDPVTGDISRVFRRFFNQASANVEGIDLEMKYNITPNFLQNQEETLSVRVLAGYLISRDDIAPNGAVTDRLLSYASPDLTGNITTTYGIGPWSLQLQGRYVDSGQLVNTWVEGIDVDDNTVASSTWWNGSVRYNGELSSGANWGLSLSVQNLFDRAPPITAGGSAGAQTVGNQYDNFGRRYNITLNVNF